MVEELERLLQEYDFISDEIDFEATIKNIIVYVRELEKSYADLSELNSILRYNLRLAERGRKC